MLESIICEKVADKRGEGEGREGGVHGEEGETHASRTAASCLASAFMIFASDLLSLSNQAKRNTKKETKRQNEGCFICVLYLTRRRKGGK